MYKLGMVVGTCNPGIWEAEAGGFLISVQPGINSETDTISRKRLLCKWVGNVPGNLCLADCIPSLLLLMPF